MPTKSAGDLIREHGELLAALSQRADHVETHLDKLETALVEVKRTYQELDKQSAISVRELERFDKKLDERNSRRWDLSKIILTILLSSIVAWLTGIVRDSMSKPVTMPSVNPK